MITVDTEELKQLESDLQTFAERAFPFAARATLNVAAFEARERIQAGMRKKMTMRNTFTMKSVQVDKARTLRVKDQEAVVGTIAPYMDEQEFGGVKTKKGKHGVPLPTTAATGEGRGARPRKRLPRASNKFAKIRLNKTSKRGFKSRKQEIFVKVLMAARSGHKVVFLDNKGTKALYRIKGRGRLDKNGRITGIKMDMIYELGHTSVRIPRTNIFLTATRAVEKSMPGIYRDALIFQLKRQGLFED